MDMRLRIVLALCCVMLAACSSVQPADRSRDAIEATRGFVAALAAIDLEGVLAAFADDATVFFPTSAAPARADGGAAIRAGFAPIIDGAKKSGLTRFNLTPEDFKAQVVGDAAVVTFHLKREGGISRRTAVLSYRNGKWVIVHLHASNMQTAKD